MMLKLGTYVHINCHVYSAFRTTFLKYSTHQCKMSASHVGNCGALTALIDFDSFLEASTNKYHVPKVHFVLFMRS